jgi:prepilin-type N-terminal cleavage/methylation domain-containing protein/prepilin-type processing-associated H-X9-DG protein
MRSEVGLSVGSAGENLHFRKGPRRGFTLIELLVVIAIIAILAAMLLPVLNKAKARSQAITCMNNSKQLAIAFHLYTGDFNELYPPNPDDGTSLPGYNWCAGDVSGGMPGMAPGAHTFDADILRDPNETLVSPYIANNVGVFKCPSDSRTGQYDGSDPAKSGMIVPAARSVSLNQAVGTVDPQFAMSGSGHSGRPTVTTSGPWLTGSHGGNQHDNPWKTFGKATDFNGVSPSTIFLMVDESPWSINDGALAVSAGSPKWIDFPATFHNNACGFSFCDGHAEVHKWRGSSLQLTAPAPSGAVGKPVSPLDPDWNWLVTHTTSK